MTADFRPVADADIASLIALWRRCDLTRPWNPPEEDIAAFRAHPEAGILVAGPPGDLRASVALGHDGHRGWVYYLATDPGFRGQGLGRAAMRAAEAWMRARGVVKLQLMVRETNEGVLGFYQGAGYEDAGVRVMQKWLDPDRARAFEENPDGH